MKLEFIDTKAENAFDLLCGKVNGCVLCSRMKDSQRVLNHSSGSLDAEIMFIGEAPGRLGADNSGIPFHGDKAGHNFEELLEFANLDRSRIFVTNAVLCNPRDESGNNSTPTKVEIHNCSQHLAEQIKILNPKIVVTLGSIALESTRHVAPHLLTLKDDVRTANEWFNRILIPLYHPGQRAMMHRSFANQRSDYQFISEEFKRLTKKSVSSKLQTSSINHSVFLIVKEIFAHLNSIDYFKLHKLFYLIEYKYFKKFNSRLTNAYIVRQKDGPYCTDLHFQKIKKALPELVIRNKAGNLILNYSASIFAPPSEIDNKAKEIIIEVLKDYGQLTSQAIKTKVYLTEPMRKFLKLENEGKLNLYNVPIEFNQTVHTAIRSLK